MDEDTAQAKRMLRATMRDSLRAATAEQRGAWTRGIVGTLTADDGWTTQGGVAGLFGGLKGEPDLLPLIPWLHGRGMKAAFFSVDGDSGLVPRLVRDVGDLTAGTLGVLEPGLACEVVPVSALTVILVPGLAFSVSDGARVGRGKAYYDRLLSMPDARGMCTIGVGFDLQMLPSVPHEPHDVRVRSLVSERGWRLNAPGASS